MLLLVVSLLALLGGVSGYLAYNQQKFILPGVVNPVPAPDPVLKFEYVSLKTPEGETLHGIVFLPEAQPVKDLVLAFPGNTHNPVGFATYLRTHVYKGRKNVAIASFSYRGYPNGHTPPSTGTPSQAAMFADAGLVYDKLTERFRPQQVKAVGYSIGTAVAAHLATVRELHALALVAPVASVRRIVKERYPWMPVGLLLRHPFATEDIFAYLTVPTTLVYSPTDGLIPTRHVTQVLHRKNPSVPLIPVEGTNHQTLALAPELPDLLRKALTP